jgi:hypothetical protein
MPGKLVLSAVIGLIYGVLLPTLPEIPRPIAWGGLLAPILWTAVSYAAMRFVNPAEILVVCQLPAAPPCWPVWQS